MKALIIASFVFLCACQSSGLQQPEKSLSIEGAWIKRTDQSETLIIYYQSYACLISRNLLTSSFHSAAIGTYRQKGSQFIGEIIYPVRGNDIHVSAGTVIVHDDTLFTNTEESVKGHRLATIQQQFVRLPAKSVDAGNLQGLWYKSESKQSQPRRDGYVGIETVTTYLLITPTHWFRFSGLLNKNYNAMAGIYIMNQDTLIGSIEYGSIPLRNGSFRLTRKRRDQHIDWFGEIKDSTGKTLERLRDMSTSKLT